MVAVVVIEFSVMRCQPLRRALGYLLITEAVDERIL
ncbi:acetyltransferase [Vibrio cholerae]|nr:acetyltransferase [Vibrio cholerae]